jgi:uncharacterized protein
MDNKDILNAIAMILVIVGGLNWLLFAFNYNLVSALFGTSIIATIVYVLIGLGAIYLLLPLYELLTTSTHKKPMSKAASK